MKHISLHINNDMLKTERQQLIDEGKDISEVEEEFEKLSKLDFDKDLSLQPKAQELLDKTIKLPQKSVYPYIEPSDLEGIRKNRADGPRKIEIKMNDEELFDKVLGAWQGRVSGCLLGKPVEGWRSPKMWGFLKDINEFPLQNYFHSDVSKDLIKKYEIQPEGPFVNNMDHMPIDDDTNYTTTGFVMMKQYGKDFKPIDVATFWINNIPLGDAYTAERIAYRNFAILIEPPGSAIFRNPFREWIGAQIRADFYGYAALGNPEQAAEYAWRDACISHIKNGIYGEMWVAAMLSAAAVENNIKKVIEIGLSEIPQKSRLFEDIKKVFSWHEEGIDYEEAITRIHKQWDENSQHHWCHTNSNAQIVVMGLLWSENDFEKAICRAVQACFDTDCNGATVGSIMGMLLGSKQLPSKWIDVYNDTLETSIKGYNKVRVSEIAREGFELYKKFGN